MQTETTKVKFKDLVRKRTLRMLENAWEKALEKGQSVYVEIKPTYPGDSLRPSILDIKYKIDGVEFNKTFKNQYGGK